MGAFRLLQDNRNLWYTRVNSWWRAAPWSTYRRRVNSSHSYIMRLWEAKIELVHETKTLSTSAIICLRVRAYISMQLRRVLCEMSPSAVRVACVPSRRVNILLAVAILHTLARAVSWQRKVHSYYQLCMHTSSASLEASIKWTKASSFQFSLGNVEQATARQYVVSVENAFIIFLGDFYFFNEMCDVNCPALCLARCLPECKRWKISQCSCFTLIAVCCCVRLGVWLVYLWEFASCHTVASDRQLSSALLYSINTHGH